MSDDDFELTVGDVSDMAATVYVRFRPAANDPAVTLRGTLRGPYCEGVRTLAAEFAFREPAPPQPGAAMTVVTDPCLWSPELPHVYHAEVEAVRGGSVVAAFRGKIALRRMQPK